MVEPSFTPLQHTEHYVIRTFEIDRLKRATVPAFIRLMHEAAMQNVIELNLSVWDLEERGISWVLLRQQLEIERLPELGERISVITYPSGFDRFFTFRDFRVYDSQLRQIAWASSAWMLMDMASRKVRRLPPFILAFGEQMPDPADCLPRPEKCGHAMEHPIKSRSYQVQYFDLDFNQHLNSTFYLKWMLESLPDEVLLRRHCRSVQLEYRAECLWKTRVKAETEADGDLRFHHRLYREADGKELALAHSTWA